LLVYGKAERLAIFDATLPSHEEIARRFLSPEQSEIFLARSAIEALDEWEPARWEASEVLSVVDELANFALEHLSTIGPQDQALDHLRKEFRVARRRNAQLRDRIKQLEAQLGADTPPEEVE
jgi:phage shock protein A